MLQRFQRRLVFTSDERVATIRWTGDSNHLRFKECGTQKSKTYASKKNTRGEELVAVGPEDAMLSLQKNRKNSSHPDVCLQRSQCLS